MTQMKHIFAAALLATACLMTHRGALAQSKMQATIPFDFTVGENKLPAGTYVMDYVQPHVIKLSSPEKNIRTFVLLVSTDEVRESPNRMIFNKYGDQYFLSEIHGGEGQVTRRLGVSNLEKRVQREEASLVNQQKTLVALK